MMTNLHIILLACAFYLITGFRDVRNLGLKRSWGQRHMTSRSRPHKLHGIEPSQEFMDVVSSIPDSYVYTPPEVGWEIWAGSVIALVPIVWASFEFYNRIATQRQCLVCRLDLISYLSSFGNFPSYSGSGLVYETKQGSPLSRPRKCYNCGGFLPWLGWKRFFLTSLFDVGNGGPLQRPAKDYDENNRRFAERQASDDNNIADEDDSSS